MTTKEKIRIIFINKMVILHRIRAPQKNELVYELLYHIQPNHFDNEKELSTRVDEAITNISQAMLTRAFDGTTYICLESNGNLFEHRFQHGCFNNFRNPHNVHPYIWLTVYEHSFHTRRAICDDN